MIIRLPETCIVLILSIMLSACVSKTTSALTKKADPVLAVKRYVDLGLEYIKRDDFQRARKHLNRALEINELDPSANAVLALIYHADGEIKQAEALFLKALDTDPAYTRGRSYYAAFLYAETRYQEALDQFILAGSDTNFATRSQIFSNIALCYLKLGKPESAVEAYRKNLRLDRFDGRALSGITEVLIQIQDFENAQQYYNRLVRLIREQGMQHSAQSLWLGIRIAQYFESEEQAKRLISLLGEMYPDSREYVNQLHSTRLEHSDD